MWLHNVSMGTKRLCEDCGARMPLVVPHADGRVTIPTSPRCDPCKVERNRKAARERARIKSAESKKQKALERIKALHVYAEPTGREEDVPAGQAPLPPGLKIALGDGVSKDRRGHEVNMGPFEDRSAPQPPQDMPIEALLEWERIVPILHTAGMITPGNRAGLVAYCLAYAKMVDPQSTTAEWKSASAELRGWCVQFGLTPSSEQNLPGAKDRDDPFADKEPPRRIPPPELRAG